ncbi:MAG: hypothetical protein R6X27_18095 [Candidatus Desulfacyla sp.]
MSKKLRRLLNSDTSKIIQALLMAAIVLTCVLYQYSERYGYRVSGFICLGYRFIPPEGIQKGLVVYARSPGYDGQFFYYIALKPFGDLKDYGNIDSLPWRYQRIGYPLLAWLFSLGNKSAVPHALLMINFLSILFSTYLISMLLKEQDLDARYSVAYAVSGTLLYPLLRDLAEIPSAAFLIAGFFFYARRRFVISGLLFGYAMLCREVVFAVVPVLILDWLVLGREKKAWVAPLLASVMMFAWHLYVALHLDAGRYPFGGALGLPGVALVNHLKQVFLLRDHVPISEKIVLISTVLIILTSMGMAIKDFVRSRSAPSICLFGFSLLPLVLKAPQWAEPWAYVRMLVPSTAFLFLCFAYSRDKLYLVPMGLHTVLFLASLSYVEVIYRF